MIQTKSLCIEMTIKCVCVCVYPQNQKHYLVFFASFFSTFLLPLQEPSLLPQSTVLLPQQRTGSPPLTFEECLMHGLPEKLLARAHQNHQQHLPNQECQYWRCIVGKENKKKSTYGGTDPNACHQRESEAVRRCAPCQNRLATTPPQPCQ